MCYGITFVMIWFSAHHYVYCVYVCVRVWLSELLGMLQYFYLFIYLTPLWPNYITLVKGLSEGSRSRLFTPRTRVLIMFETNLCKPFSDSLRLNLNKSTWTMCITAGQKGWVPLQRRLIAQASSIKAKILAWWIPKKVSKCDQHISLLLCCKIQDCRVSKKHLVTTLTPLLLGIASTQDGLTHVVLCHHAGMGSLMTHAVYGAFTPVLLIIA